MTGKAPQVLVANSFTTLFNRNILPWVICGLAAAFYCYEYLIRITPGLMVGDLQLSFSVNGMPLDATKVGYLSAFYYYAYTPMQLPVGLLMDRYGPRSILTIAVFCCALGAVLFGYTHSYWIAAFGRFLAGFGSAFAFVGVLKLASTWLPPNRFALVSGLTTTLGMIGAMAGAVLLTKLIGSIGWRETLHYSSYIGFILVPIIWLIIRDAPSESQFDPRYHTPPPPNMTYSMLWSEIRLSLRNPQIWLAGIVGGLLMTPTMVFPELWGKLYLETVYNLTAKESSEVIVMIFLGWAVGSPISGFISDTLRRRKAPLVVGSIFASLLLFVFFYYPNLTVFQMKALLFFIGITSSVQVICFALGRENCSSSLAGTAIAVTNFLVVSFSFFQIVVAQILDRTWGGQVINEIRVYSPENYKTAMLVLPLATCLALVVILFLKETHCRSFEERA